MREWVRMCLSVCQCVWHSWASSLSLLLIHSRSRFFVLLYCLYLWIFWEQALQCVYVCIFSYSLISYSVHYNIRFTSVFIGNNILVCLCMCVILMLLHLFLVCLLVCDQISAFGIVLYLRIQRSFFTINCSALWEKFLMSLTRIAPVWFRAALLYVCLFECMSEFSIGFSRKTVVCLCVCACICVWWRL